MAYLISILIAGLLFLGFLLLTIYEFRRGARFFARSRYKLDAKVSRTGFLIEHIDWGAFTAHLTRMSLNTIAHDAAHATLMLVRSVERNLARAVSSLHMRREPPLALPEKREVTSPPARPMSDILRKQTEEGRESTN